MFAQNAQEEAKLDAMQRHWQIRRGASTSLLEDVNNTEDLLSPLPIQRTRGSAPRGPCVPPPTPPTYTCSDVDSDSEVWETHDLITPQEEEEKSFLILNASSIGDFPATYKISQPEPHQLPVIGVYVDKRIAPGFKYKVRPLPAIGSKTTNKCLFDNKALTLKSIGRGYARRFTFEADHNKLNKNENYFWSDNRPEGYGFELELISDGDKFTIFDLNGVAQGTVEVLKLEAPQIEISSCHTRLGLEKRANVKFTGKVEFYETGVAKPMPLTGTVVSIKGKGKGTAEVLKVANVAIRKQRYYLSPGVQKIHRRVTVRGQDINDVPTKYTMTGLEQYEIPVVGTYVDPRVIPGFYYKVRPNDRKDHLFGGRALRLLSIGMGYAKRLTFQPDSLLEPNNYLWSDNHPDGIGLEIRALHTGMKFSIQAGDHILGEAQVFRADKPQFEEKMDKIETASGIAIEKHIHVDVMCHIKLARTGGATIENEEYLMRICGVAIVRKEPKSSEAKVIRVENLGLDSQLNVLFAQTHTELTFIPKY